MCGIAGFIDSTKSLEDLKAMTNALIRRGPDDEGYFFEQGVGLGHRRLSIIDLSICGHQPMFFEDLVIIFNGEIYNYKEVKKELEKEGYSFESSSDTEVVIKSFHCWKEKCVSRFIGMFAFAIYNKADRSIYLFRDRVGVKPLYYYHKKGKFAFGSELKAFKSYLDPGEASQLNTQSLSLFFQLGYIASNESIINNVRKLPPGHYLELKGDKLNIHEYWNVNFNENKGWLKRKEEDILDELENIIIDAFCYRMVSDVPVGVFLSAGIDSSMVAAVLRKNYGEIETFTIGFDDPSFDESKEAAEIAGFLKTNHHSAVLKSGKALQILESFYDIYDEPHGDNSCVPTTFVSELAKQHGAKVVLSADGGDELFGGYTRYTESYNRWKQVNRWGRFSKRPAALGFTTAAMFTRKFQGDKFTRFADILSRSEFHEFYQSLMFTSSSRERKNILPFYEEIIFYVPPNNLYNQMMDFDFRTYMVNNNLVKVDRATMFQSIEGREPFLDHRIIEFAVQLPIKFKIKNGVNKYILRKLLKRYLPDHLCNLPKRGFGAPLQQWIQSDFKNNLKKVFLESGFYNPYLDKKNVLVLLEDYLQDKPVNLILLWLIYSFQLWFNKWNDK